MDGHMENLLLPGATYYFCLLHKNFFTLARTKLKAAIDTSDLVNMWIE